MGGDGGDIVYNSQLDAFELYHLIQEQPDSARLTFHGGTALPALGHALAGSLATASARVLLYPLELVTTRLQVQRQLQGAKEAPSAARDANAEYSSFVDAFKKIYHDEGGLRAFYTGCGPDIGKGIADSFLFFLAYTALRHYSIRRSGSKHLSIARELSVGIAAGALAKLITTPIQNIVTRQQTAALVAARDPTSSTYSLEDSDRVSIKDVAVQIRKERGLAGFWAGYSASQILTLNPAITFAVDNLLKRLLLKPSKEKPRAAFIFAIAALSKALATIITYPVMLAKARAQVSAPATISEAEGTEKTDFDPKGLANKPDDTPAKVRRELKHRSRQAFRLLSAQFAIFLSLRKIYHNEGLAGLYSGLESEVLKGFLSHGVTMTAKDRVHIGVIELYYVLLRITRRWPAELQRAGDGLKAGTADVQARVDSVGETLSQGVKSMANEGKHLL
ncbi:hypothetical protein M433DRAFT_77885 [Acidomyces richmondensis BFW]|nr:hypothetical protein M433DRAFT_77885 [Acidomyces richmondensis BFW]